MTRMPRALALSAALVFVALASTACTPTPPAPSAPPSASPSAPVSASPAPVSASPAPAGFATPTSCAGMLGALEAQFLADGNVLFSDPTGAGIAPTAPIGQDGGTPFACLYGMDGVDLSTFELSAQSLTPDAHEGTLAELQTRALVQTDEQGRTVFSQEGTEGSDPAIVHLLYPEGWITVDSTFGGAARLVEITGWADAVAAILTAP